MPLHILEKLGFMRGGTMTLPHQTVSDSPKCKILHEGIVLEDLVNILQAFLIT